METTTSLQPIVSRERVGVGVTLIVIGLVMLLLFARGTQPGETATFGMSVARSAEVVEVPDLVLPVQASQYVLALVTVFLGAFQLARGVRSTGWMIGVVAFAFVAAFLVWATAGKSFNLVGMLSSTLARATPIALAALCGVISERSAVVNIGIDGIMLMSAQAAVMTATLTDSLMLGLLAALLMGALVAGVHAFLIIRFKVDQIVSGVAINIFGAGMTAYIAQRYLEMNVDLLNNSGTFKIISIPLLSKIPVLGPVLFENSPIIYLLLLIVIVLHVVLYYTPWGLRTRAVGEHPKAADTLGVKVYLTQYINVIIGGVIAGLGGAYFTLGAVGRFDENMTAGRGFIGLAAVIFGKWNPIGAFLASLLFGFADSLQVKMQILNVPIPSSFLAMAPYVITMVVLTGIVGRAVSPAADGVTYEK